MVYDQFRDLILVYLEQLRGRPCHGTRVRTAGQWILKQPTTPTRKEVLARHLAKGHGDYLPGSMQANMELALLRAACRWGMYQECWDGGDPTAGIRKWKRPKRRRTGKFEELKTLLRHFEQAATDIEIRDRALFGLMLCTGCRPSEARRARLDAITPYGEMGCWQKGKTKTGEPQELPLPRQFMPWLAAWQAIRHLDRTNPYIFPGCGFQNPLSSSQVTISWRALRTRLGLHGLWNYDLRRTLASSMSNELGYDDSTIRAILNHNDTSALGHYLMKSFDSLTTPMQRYADWLWSLKGATGSPEPALPRVSAPEAPAPRLPAPPSIPTVPEPLPEPVRHQAMRPLTGRERQILALIADGRSYQEIAGCLKLSISTVGCYRGRLLDRLQLTTTGELIAYAREHALTAMPMVVIKRGRIGADRPRTTHSRTRELAGVSGT